MSSNNRLFRYGESALFCLIFLYAGLHFRPADPFLFFSSYQVYIPFSIVLTLAGGTGAGLIALTFAALMSRFFYFPYPYNPLLWNALVVLVAGEFKIYWDRRIHLYSQERDYFRDKLKDLTRNFVIMKMSHERLEKNYILRPVSIRGSLESIRGMLQNDPCAAAASLMDLLSNFYGLESSALFIKRPAGRNSSCGLEKSFFKEPGKDWAEAAKTGAGAQLDIEDPLIQLAMRRRDAAFFSVSQLKGESGSAYIAVIPYFAQGEEQEPLAFILVRDMPFLRLNRDNLLTITLYLSYFMTEFMDTSSFQSAAVRYPHLDSTIFKEIARLQKLRKDFGVESVLVRFRADYGDISKEVASYIESEIRGIDLSYGSCGETCVVLVILPLTSYANAAVFIERVKGRILSGFASFSGSLETKALPITGSDVQSLLDTVMAK